MDEEQELSQTRKTVSKALSVFCVGTDLEQKEGRELAAHVSSCQSHPCAIEGCEKARFLSIHFKQCTQTDCNTCTVLKLLELKKNPGENTNELESLYVKQFEVVGTLFVTLQNLEKLALVKKKGDDHTDLNETMEKTRVLMVHEARMLTEVAVEIDKVYKSQ
jgi:hypothetical protein